MPSSVRLGMRLVALGLLAILVVAPGIVLGDDPSASDATVSSDPVFKVQRLDGTTASGRIARLSLDGSLSLQGEPGRPIPLGQVVSLVRDRDASPAAPEGSLVLFPDGDRLRAIIGAGGDTTLDVLPGALGDVPTTVPLDSLLGVVLAPPADRAAQEALMRRVRDEPRDSEVLWLINGDRLSGSLLGLGTEKVSFQPDTGPIMLGRASVVALGFDPAVVHYPRPEGTFLELGFLDGSRLGVGEARIERGQLIARTRFGVEVHLPLTSLARIVVRSDAVSYLSDRPVAAAQYVGYLGEHPKVHGHDTTWDGQSMRIAGQTYDRGLGTLPRTLLAYRLDPTDRRFQALVGLDDRAGELASVIFRVLVDGKERFASPVMTRRSTPALLNVDVSGGKLLILVTEFGERGDVQDSADWAEARLVR